jgi:hypothetical protein
MRNARTSGMRAHHLTPSAGRTGRLQQLNEAYVDIQSEQVALGRKLG